MQRALETVLFLMGAETVQVRCAGRCQYQSGDTAPIKKRNNKGDYDEKQDAQYGLPLQKP